MILYNKSGSVTARNLARLLKMKAIRDDKWTRGIPTIRWGSSKPIPGDTCRINSALSIGNTSDGFVSLNIMRDYGIPVPDIYRFHEVPSNVDVLARKRYHRAGTDIIFCRNLQEVRDAYNQQRVYFTKYILTSIELRVHVINGEVVKGFRKIKENDEDVIPIRSSNKGWGYKRVDIFEHYPEVIPIVLAVGEALNLTFYAIDMARKRVDRSWVIWEANTAPALNVSTLALYGNRLSRLING